MKPRHRFQSLMILVVGILTAPLACKSENDKGSESDSLEDLERGSYVAEFCRADRGATLQFNTSRIKVFGKSCNDGSKLSVQEKTVCTEITESIKTLPGKIQTYLDQQVGMAIIVDTKERTKNLANSAFVADEVSISNVTSFWTSANANGNSYLATVIRVDNLENARKDISYSVLRTLGDFLARGAFSTTRKNGLFILDPTQTANIPESYLDAQAGITKKFLSLVKNKDTNKLLQSIVGSDISLLSNFPTSIKENIKARNLASLVTTEALHQYYCNSDLRSEFTTGKYQILKSDLDQILSAIDFAVDAANQSESLKPTTDSTGVGLSLTQGSFLDELRVYFQSLDQRSLPQPAQVAQTVQSAQQNTNALLAAELAGISCPNCNGKCQCGGNCQCASSGCNCANGGPCTCVGGCTCGLTTA